MNGGERPGGGRCPSVIHAPRSKQGLVAWALLTSGGGQWNRAGMSGAIIGLDIQACLNHPLADGEDREILSALLYAGEIGVLEADSKRQSSNGDDWHTTGGE